MNTFMKNITFFVLTILVPFFMLSNAHAVNAPKSVVARVTKADGVSYPTNAAITITVTDAFDQTAMYISGSDPDNIIAYSESNGAISIQMGNFVNQWAAGHLLSIHANIGTPGNPGHEEGWTETTLDHHSLQAFTMDSNLDF